MAQDRIITLAAVRCALDCAVLRQRSPAPVVARIAAYTNREMFPVDCASAGRGHPPAAGPVVHLAPLGRGGLLDVLCRVAAHGSAEVRRTWGAPERVLRAEFMGGVL